MTNKKININVVPKDKIIVKFKDDKTNKVEIDDIIKVDYNGIVGVALELDKANGILSLLDKKGNVLSQVDFPTEKIITNAFYDDTTKELVIDFESANQVRIPIDFTDEIESAINEFESRVNTQFSQFKESVNTSFQEVNQKIDDLEKEINTNINSQVETLNQKVDTLEDTINNNIGKQVESLNKSIEEINNSKVDKVEGKQLSTNDLTDELLAKLNGLKNYDDTELLAKIQSIENILKSDNLDLDTLQEIANALATTNASLESVKVTLNELSTNLNNNHYTKEEIELKLEEIKAIKDVEKISTENVNENVLYRTFDSDNNISKIFNIKNGIAQELQNKLIASSGIEINDKTNEISSYAIRSANEVKEVKNIAWKTPVPESGFIEKVYYNVNLTKDEVVAILETLTFVSYNGFNLASCISDTTTSNGLYVMRIPNNNEYNYVITAIVNAVEIGIFTSDTVIAETGWLDTTGYVEFNMENQLVQVGQHINYTLENSKMGGLFSATPTFEQVETSTEYIGNEKCIYGDSDNLFYLQNKQKKIIATQEDLSIQDVEELPKDGEDVKVAIPTLGIVDTVYFNTDLSVDEVVALIDKLSVKEYYVFVNEESIQSGDVMAIMIDKSSYSIYCSVDGVSNKIFTQSSGWDTSFPNSVTFNLQNDMTVMRHELQNDILVKLMYCIKIEKAKINENVLYRVEEKGGWSGTTVPNTGYVENVYFNTNLSVEEVVNIIESANLDYSFQDMISFVLSDETTNKSINVFNVNGVYVIMFGEGNFVFASGDLSSSLGISLIGWSTDFNGVYEFNNNAISNVEMEDSIISIGTENDKLSSLFSITPFVQATGKPQLYHFKDRVPYKVGLTKEDVIDIINAEFSKAEGSAF